MPTAGEGPGDYALDSSAALSLVERLRRRVLLEHPEVEAGGPTMGDEMAGCFLQEISADPESLELMTDVEIVQERSPGRVGVANGVRESHDDVITNSHEREVVRLLLTEPLRPYCAALSDHISIKESIRERASIVAPPAIGMHSGDRLNVPSSRPPENHPRRSVTTRQRHCQIFSVLRQAPEIPTVRPTATAPKEWGAPALLRTPVVSPLASPAGTPAGNHVTARVHGAAALHKRAWVSPEAG